MVYYVSNLQLPNTDNICTDLHILPILLKAQSDIGHLGLTMFLLNSSKA